MDPCGDAGPSSISGGYVGRFNGGWPAAGATAVGGIASAELCAETMRGGSEEMDSHLAGERINHYCTVCTLINHCCTVCTLLNPRYTVRTRIDPSPLRRSYALYLHCTHSTVCTLINPSQEMVRAVEVHRESMVRACRVVCNSSVRLLRLAWRAWFHAVEYHQLRADRHSHGVRSNFLAY
jgi:hypothetical protein